MTPAEHARNQAITLEAKKDALSQRQSGDWKVSFTVQGVDMVARLTQAPMGTRYAMVLVEIGDDELPVPAKESAASRQDEPQAETPDGERRPWRDMQPSAQAAMRCDQPKFWAFLREEHKQRVATKDDAATAVRKICEVNSRAHFNENHKARTMWHQLDSQYLAWDEMERARA